MKAKKRTNEEIIATLIRTGSIKETAKTLNIMPRTIYNRSKTLEYQQEYTKARRLIIEDAANSLRGKTGEAIDTIYKIMKNESASNQTRMACAESILRHTEKIENIQELYRRLDELEKQAEAPSYWIE